MFGHMKAQPILTLRIGHSLEEALARLIEATEGVQVVPQLYREFSLAGSAGGIGVSQDSSS